MPVEKFRVTFTASGRNDRMTMFIPDFPLAVCSFSVKLSSFYVSIRSQNYFCAILIFELFFFFFFQENINTDLTIAVCRKRDSKSLLSQLPDIQTSVHFSLKIRFHECILLTL